MRLVIYRTTKSVRAVSSRIFIFSSLWKGLNTINSRLIWTRIYNSDLKQRYEFFFSSAKCNSIWEFFTLIWTLSILRKRTKLFSVISFLFNMECLCFFSSLSLFVRFFAIGNDTSNMQGRTTWERNITWPRSWVNCGSLLSSTKFSQVMSRIHFFGLGSTAFKSSAAPPADQTRKATQLYFQPCSVWFPCSR